MKRLLPLLVVLALLFLGVQGFLGSDAVRARVIAELEAALHREARVGAVTVGLARAFPSLAATLTDVEIHDPAYPGEEPLRLGSVRAEVAPLPLFRDELVFALVLADARLPLVVRRDGSTNLSHLVSAEWLAADSASGSFETVRLRRFALTEVDLAYQAPGRTFTLAGLDAEATAFFGPDSLAFDGTLTLRSVRPHADAALEPLDATLTFVLVATPAQHRLHTAQLALGPHRLDLAGLPLDAQTLPKLLDLALGLRALAALPPDALARERARLEAEARNLIAAEKARLRQRLGDALDRLLRW